MPVPVRKAPRIQTERFQKALIAERGSILKRVSQLESEWQQLPRRAIENEEEAQAEKAASEIDRLDSLETRRVEAINRALARIEAGTYGICRRCGRNIQPARLRAMPMTELCVSCAEEGELRKGRYAAPAEAEEGGQWAEDAEGLSDEQLEDLVLERLSEDDRLDLSEITIGVKDRVVTLGGALPSEEQREIISKILTDFIGASEINDRMTVDTLVFETEEKNPGLTPDDEEGKLQEELFYGDEEPEDPNEDDFSTDDRSYEPPDRPQSDPKE